jgi:REP element-mobilizing transposase RayT
MPQSFTVLHCHIVFSTKNRTPRITADLQPRLYEYLGGILRAENSPLLAVGGMPDHVHLLVSLSKQKSVSDTLRVLKANSSKWVHETFPGMGDFAWQAGYGAFAVSCSNLEKVERYIANQAAHHRTMSFQEEFVALLQRHEIEFEERHLWE